MKFKYSLLILVALIVSILIIVPLSGCSSEPATTTSSSVVTTPAQSSSSSPTVKTTIPAVPVTLNISAAASLTDALKAINALYTQGKSNVTITPNFAASGTLQTQIENGAPADIFISAAAKQMDNLQNESLILKDTRKNLLNNTLVMVVPVDSTLGLTSFNDLTDSKVAKIAIGNPKSVPCGTYAVKAFDELGITTQISSKYVMGADVKGVLSYVESGNVDAGFVYSTDSLISSKVKVVAKAPADINAQIVYPAAVVQASKNPDVARDYLNFLFSTQAKAVFEKYGFTMVTK